MTARLLIRRALLPLTVLLTVGAACLAVAADASRHEVQIVATEDSDSTRRILQDLRQRFPAAQLITDPARRKPGGRDTVSIAIGPSALRALLAARGEGAIIAAYTSSQVYRAIVETAPERRAALTAIYAEPSPATQLHLIGMLYKRPVGTAVILSPRTAALEAVVRRAASQQHLPLTVETNTTSATLNRALNRIADIPVILAMPDSGIYNAENLRSILLTTYRSNQALVGFSVALVNAGALATTYSEIEDIGAQVDDIVAEFEATGRLPEPQFPKYFRTLVNEDVARSLNIVIDDAAKNYARKPVPMRQP